MKAYFVWWDEDWGMFIHAGTDGIAKSVFLEQNPTLEYIPFTQVRTKRHPALDEIPFTDVSIKATGYPLAWEENDSEWTKDAWLDFCPCEICKGAKEGTHHEQQNRV